MQSKHELFCLLTNLLRTTSFELQSCRVKYGYLPVAQCNSSVVLPWNDNVVRDSILIVTCNACHHGTVDNTVCVYICLYSSHYVPLCESINYGKCKHDDDLIKHRLWQWCIFQSFSIDISTVARLCVELWLVCSPIMTSIIDTMAVTVALVGCFVAFFSCLQPKNV